VKSTLETPSPVTRQAVMAAVLMMAWQVSAKAARDSLFLSAFPADALPAIVGASAICSIFMALLSSRLMLRWGPSRLIPSGYLLGGLIHLCEWMLLPRFPRAISAILYVHVIALGSVLLSGFWALISDRFDPREARKRFGQIAAFGTLGALIGGLLSERVASLSSPLQLLLLLAILQIAGAAALLRLGAERVKARRHEVPSIPEVISGAPYLMQLAMFVLLISMSAATLDYLFKSQAVGHFGRGPSLSRFFALFYAVVSVLTFLVQAGLTRRWLNRFGPGHTVAALPISVAGVSVLSLMFPGAVALTISRGVEQLFRGSLFRSGYELFFTPMPDAEKRSAKSVIDIGADRLGDGLAAAAIQLFLVLPAATSRTALLVLTAILSGLGAWISFRLDRAYVKVLEKGLEQNTVTITPEQAEDALTKTVVLRTQSTMMRPAAQAGAPPVPAQSQSLSQTQAVDDPIVLLTVELRSGNPARVRAVLRRKELLPLPIVGQVIMLLGRDELARDVHEALLAMVDRVSGQLGDALADSTIDLNIRRRIPRILAAGKSPLAHAALVRQLHDERFEIRQRCAKALEKICETNRNVKVDSELVLDAVGRELRGGQRVFDHRRAHAIAGSQPLTADRVVADRASQTMSHIATLLGLIFPAQSVRLAFRALEVKDSKLRGVALEYLESILPKNLAEQFMACFEAGGTRPSATSKDQALANLLESSPSLMIQMDKLNPVEDDVDGQHMEGETGVA
jgi:AAA family ATP:ADP antiporter